MSIINIDPISCIKITKSYADFSYAGLLTDIELMSIYPGMIIHGIKIKHAVLFAASGLSSCKLSVGVSGALDKYASKFEMFSGVSDTNLQISECFGTEDHGSVVSLRGSIINIGANLNTLSAGSVDIWVYYSKAR
jgi:hypothetical protein